MSRLWDMAVRCGFYALLLPLVSTAAPTKDFEVKAFYVDCRTEVMTLEAMKRLASDIAGQGMNALVVEWEATFPFTKHATLCNRYAFTEGQVRDLVSYCAGLGVEVIPLQNCFGHSEYILRHDRYRHLSESAREVSQVCPLKIGEATKIFTEIFAEVARLHPSKYFHIGADETYLLGSCKDCAAVAAASKDGKSRLFVDYVKAMSRIVIDMGKIPVIWADIILAYPEAVSELPKEMIFVDWNYGWKPDHFGKLENLFRAGVKIWGAPSLRSGPDNQYLTQWKKHFDNLSVFVPFARDSGYTGMIQTSWSTSGTYGFHYDMSYEVLDMQPVRLVYPMAGFNALVAAYCRAVNDPLPLDGPRFVEEYARTRYGLDPSGGATLWDYFCMSQEAVVPGGKDAKGAPIGRVLEECLTVRTRLAGLKPRSNADEFAHYPLMLDLRINYLRYKEVEAEYESPSYDRGKQAALAAKLRPVVEEAARLDKRFARLNRDYLKPGEIEYMTIMRNEKMKALYSWLSTNK
ncbi:hypothetical protein FACS1894159_03770 [Bacteroidia bacterium]|nr:hypothetical protein FACS1894159_03770 [Bacteroidia bacterium]